MRVNELRQKLTSIEIGVGIELSYGDEFEEKLLDSKLIKQIFRYIRNWLEEKPIIGSSIIFGDFQFKVIHYNDKWKDAQIVGPINSLWVDGHSLKEKIEGKIKKYESLIEDLKVPFVVGVVPDFTTGVSKNTLDDVLYGQEVYVVRRDNSAILDRKLDGILDQKKNISAVIGYFNGEINVFNNPNAKLPLEISI